MATGAGAHAERTHLAPTSPSPILTLPSTLPLNLPLNLPSASSATLARLRVLAATRSCMGACAFKELTNPGRIS